MYNLIKWTEKHGVDVGHIVGYSKDCTHTAQDNTNYPQDQPDDRQCIPEFCQLVGTFIELKLRPLDHAGGFRKSHGCLQSRYLDIIATIPVIWKLDLVKSSSADRDSAERIWSGRAELNRRPLRPERSALTGLSHAPNRQGGIIPASN